ncbi:MAG: hypothetical protein HY898_23280 [Deltaproteobacteria bacterium]|nr:hypothetical protein [Deltaproteobacteria bacterium]
MPLVRFASVLALTLCSCGAPQPAPSESLQPVSIVISPAPASSPPSALRAPRDAAAPPAAPLLSCESVIQSHLEETAGTSSGPDLSAGAYGAVLNQGSYVAACKAPAELTVRVCAAIRQGRAVGVTVRTEPRDEQVEGCIDAPVRAMAFPSSQRLDVTRTVFQGQ